MALVIIETSINDFTGTGRVAFLSETGFEFGFYYYNGTDFEISEVTMSVMNDLSGSIALTKDLRKWYDELVRRFGLEFNKYAEFDEDIEANVSKIVFALKFQKTLFITADYDIASKMTTFGTRDAFVLTGREFNKWVKFLEDFIDEVTMQT